MSGNPFEKKTPGEISREDLKTFYKRTGKVEELKELEKPPVPQLEGEYLTMLAKIDNELLERTITRLKIFFAPPVPDNFDPEIQEILEEDEVKNLLRVLAIVSFDQGGDPRLAQGMMNKIIGHERLKSADITLLEDSIKEFQKYV